MTAPQVYVAGDYDHEIQDTECAWCPDLIGQCRYVYSPAGERFHIECWDEVTADVPAPVESFAGRAADAYDKAVGF